MDDFETAKQFFFEGLTSLEANNLQAAKTQFARALRIIPKRVSTLNNLSAVKIRLNKFAEAGELAVKAAMNLFSAANKLVPNPKQAADSLKLSFQRYFTSVLAPP